MDGPLLPGREAERNIGSMRSKSFSSRMRCTRTDPTIPRQPTIPTLNMAISLWTLERGQNGLAHLLRAHLLRARLDDVGGAITLLQYFLHRSLDPVCRGQLLQRVTQHHGRRQDRGERVRDVLSRDIGRRAMDRLVQPLVL